MNKAVLFLLATTIGLGIISLHLVRTLRAEREQVSALQAQIDRMERAQLQAAEAMRAQRAIENPFQRIAPSSSATSLLAMTPPVADKPAPAAVPAAATASISGPVPAKQPEMPSREDRIRLMQENMKRQRALLQDPEYRDAVRSQRKLMYARSYPELAQALDLSPAQLDQMTTLLADQQLRAMESMEPWWGDDSPDQAEMQERMRKAQLQQQKNEAELADLLGPTKLQEWKDYQQSLGARHEVRQLRTMLSSKGIPLQEELVEPLVKALANEQQRLANESTSSGVAGATAFGPAPGVFVVHGATSSTGESQAEFQQRELERMTKYYQRLRDAAATVLSPEQLQVLEEQQKAQLKMQQAQMRLMQIQAESQGRGDAAGSTPVNAAISTGTIVPR